MKQKLIKEEVIVKNIKQLELELKKFAESFNLKQAKFKCKTPSFTLLARFEKGQVKFKNKSHTHWDGFFTDKDWAQSKRFSIYLVKH